MKESGNFKKFLKRQWQKEYKYLWKKKKNPSDNGTKVKRNKFKNNNVTKNVPPDSHDALTTFSVLMHIF